MIWALQRGKQAQREKYCYIYYITSRLFWVGFFWLQVTEHPMPASLSRQKDFADSDFWKAQGTEAQAQVERVTNSVFGSQALLALCLLSSRLPCSVTSWQSTSSLNLSKVQGQMERLCLPLQNLQLGCLLSIVVQKDATLNAQSHMEYLDVSQPHSWSQRPATVQSRNQKVLVQILGALPRFNSGFGVAQLRLLRAFVAVKDVYASLHFR